MIRSAKPMIDLLILLLLLFSGQQVATTVQSQDISVSEGEPFQDELASNDAATDKLKRLSVNLLSNGSLLFNDEETSLSDLLKKARAERVVKAYIHIDDDVSYIRIREVIRELSNNGLAIELG